MYSELMLGLHSHLCMILPRIRALCIAVHVNLNLTQVQRMKYEKDGRERMKLMKKMRWMGLGSYELFRVDQAVLCDWLIMLESTRNLIQPEHLKCTC